MTQELLAPISDANLARTPRRRPDHSRSAPRLVFTASGMVLGLLPAGEIDSETLELQAGDTLVLFTDGVSEAYDPAEELFGEERLLAHLAASPGRNAGETTLGVLEAVRRHRAGAKQSDDITILTVRYAGPS